MAPSHLEDEKSGEFNEKSPPPTPSPTPKRTSFFFSKKKQPKDDDSETSQPVEPGKPDEPLLKPVSFTEMFRSVVATSSLYAMS